MLFQYKYGYSNGPFGNAEKEHACYTCDNYRVAVAANWCYMHFPDVVTS